MTPKAPTDYQNDPALITKRQQLAEARANLPTLEYAERRRREDLDRLQLAAERLAALASVNRAGKKAAAQATTVADDAKRVWAAASADAEDCRAAIDQLTREIPTIEADARRRGLADAVTDLRDLLVALFNTPLADTPAVLDAIECYRSGLLDHYVTYDTAGAGAAYHRVIADAPAELRELITVAGFAARMFSGSAGRRLGRLIEIAQAAKVAA